MSTEKIDFQEFCESGGLNEDFISNEDGVVSWERDDGDVKVTAQIEIYDESGQARLQFSRYEHDGDSKVETVSFVLLKGEEDDYLELAPDYDGEAIEDLVSEFFEGLTETELA